MSEPISIMWLFEVTLFQVGDIVRISETAFVDSDEVGDIIAQGQLAEIVEIMDDGIGEDYVSETLYRVFVLESADLYVCPIDSELKLVRRDE